MSLDGLLTDAPQVSAYELTLAKQMADTLHKNYPGHLWAVSVNAKQGMADIRNMALAGNWGYRLKLVDHFTASDWDKQVMRAGGEILERYKIARAKANTEQLAWLPTDFAGRHTAILD
jgi:hypothetical protein